MLNTIRRLITLNKKKALEQNSKDSHRPFVGRMMEKLATQANVKIVVEPKYGFVGRIECPDGSYRYFRNTNFDLNNLGSTEISKDKDYAAYFLKMLGFNVPQGKAFFSKSWCKKIGEDLGIDKAYEFAKSIGFPLIVKPNSKSQGVGVYKVANKKEFYSAMKRIFRIDNIALVQKIAIGNDFRIVVFDGEVISAYQRVALQIKGDGVSTIGKLIQAKQNELDNSDRDSVQKMDNFRLNLTLRQHKYSKKDVLLKNKTLRLMPNSNLCSGGTSVDFTDKINPSYAKLCADITKGMGLRLCGVDLMINGSLSDELESDSYVVIEINSAPGVDNFAASGEEQAKIVDGLYLKILQAIAKL